MTEIINKNLTAPKYYDRGYKWLHWSMAVLICLMFFALVGFATTTTPEEHITMLVGHSSMGILISILLVLRLTKRFVVRDPQPIQQLPKWQHIASKSVHMGLYACMVLVPVSGYLTARLHELPVKAFSFLNLNQASIQVYDQAAFEMVRNVHAFGIRLIMVLLVLHVGAAIFHKYVRKDGVLGTMMTFKSN